MQLRPRKPAMPPKALPSDQNPPPTKKAAPRKPATKASTTKRGKAGASAPKPGAKSAAQVGVGGVGASGQAGQAGTSKGAKRVPLQKGASSAAAKPPPQPKFNVNCPEGWKEYDPYWSTRGNTGNMEKHVTATEDPRPSSDSAPVATDRNTTSGSGQSNAIKGWDTKGQDAMKVEIAKPKGKRGQYMEPFKHNVHSWRVDIPEPQAASSSSQPDAAVGELFQPQGLTASHQDVAPTHDDAADALHQQMQRLSARTPSPQEASDATTGDGDLGTSSAKGEVQDPTEAPPLLRSETHSPLSDFPNGPLTPPAHDVPAADNTSGGAKDQDVLQPAAFEAPVEASNPATPSAAAVSAHPQGAQLLAPQPAYPADFRQASDIESAAEPTQTSNINVTTRPNTRKRAREDAGASKVVNQAEAGSSSRPKRQRKHAKPAGDLPRA